MGVHTVYMTFPSSVSVTCYQKKTERRTNEKTIVAVQCTMAEEKNEIRIRRFDFYKFYDFLSHFGGKLKENRFKNIPRFSTCIIVRVVR